MAGRLIFSRQRNNLQQTYIHR